MVTRMAFAGFRHGHILGLYDLASKAHDVRVAAACEEDEAARRSLAEGGRVKITHESIEQMLATVDCDAVAIGDYYGRRGGIAIAALERGLHVIADKPLCTSLAEQGRIEELARGRGLKVGCMLDMRDAGAFIGARDLLRRGRIGAVQAIVFGGQHPLLPGARPGWYFEPGKHGGTINDIGIHAFDFIPWATGLRFTRVTAARCWNAFLPDCPHFRDGAQVMLCMENGCGVLGDVSYFAPDSMGYTSPFYWRMTFWGRTGVLEASSAAPQIALALNGEKQVIYVDPPAGNPGGYLAAFLDDVAGRPQPDGPSTETVLRASRVALTVQVAGDEGLRDVPL
jgi:predicted dehydrogenase